MVEIDMTDDEFIISLEKEVTEQTELINLDYVTGRINNYEEEINKLRSFLKDNGIHLSNDRLFVVTIENIEKAILFKLRI